MEFASVPGGVFGMGSTQEEVDRCVSYWGSRLSEGSHTQDTLRLWISKEYPKHEVKVRAFQIGRFPVTNAQYRDFLSANRGVTPESGRRGEPDNHPVWGVTFDDAVRYADWMGSQMGARCRLPTESEWEYAARGPTGFEYPFGDVFHALKCNTMESGIGHTTPVDRYAEYASGFGACDMAGNVEEWTADFYEPHPGGAFVEDDLVSACGRQYRVVRGGSFALGGDLARCARRHGPLPGIAYRYRGFRLAFCGEE